ncbi:MAG: methane monooxygenase/ammonia monooxygenase subunit B [Cycloclasticus sp.]|nr:methane monooxygenase/ammonia monooxygenase subunit B [Cycloclasticus sp.]
MGRNNDMLNANVIKKLVLSFVLLTISTVLYAHGERNQEPFLRMKTLHWYDVEWSVKNEGTLKVNEEMTMKGRVHFFSRWPQVISKPDTVFLSVGTPGPVFIRKFSYLNEVPMIQSTGVETGKSYDFEVILKARLPGRHHVHPMFNVESAGGLVGPGIWVNIEGNADDFVYGVETRTGQTIENLGTYATANVYKWHAIWAAIAVLWLLWWIRRPLLIQRYLLVKDGQWSTLITLTDKKLAATMIIGIIGLLIYANGVTKEEYRYTIPLQGGKAEVDAVLNPDEGKVYVKNKKAEYYLPGRSVIIDAEITNNHNLPIQLGEFTSANLRFINHHVPAAVAALDEDYPDELVADSTLVVDDLRPIMPGETRRLHIDATDAAWEVERLSSLLNDPDSSYGALLFFYDSNGKRFISEIYGQILPTFVD